MENIKIENGKIYNNAQGKADIFQIVEKAPAGFYIWNIGENMGTHNYIPFAEDLRPEDKDDYSVNPSTLKAIKVTQEEWEVLCNAGHWGIGNLKQVEKALKSKRKGYISNKKRAYAELTIDIFRRICE